MEEKNKKEKKEEITKEQALNVVKQICSSYKGTLQDHMLIQNAITILEK